MDPHLIVRAPLPIVLSDHFGLGVGRKASLLFHFVKFTLSLCIEQIAESLFLPELCFLA